MFQGKPWPDMSGMFERWDRPQRPRLKQKKCPHPLAALSITQLYLLKSGRMVHCPGCYGPLQIARR